MNQDYYREQGIMTSLEGLKSDIGILPNTIEKVVELVQNIYIHAHVAHLYGVEITPSGWEESRVRDIRSKIERIKEKGYTPLTQTRRSKEKYVGICRDLTITTVAFLREIGIPARARCGFATYLTQGKFEDHWLVEYYNVNENRWIKVDAQMDKVQQKIFPIKNPFDVTDDEFITGPRAWQMCRQAKADPNLFGILEWWGYGYLSCNLILDANALLKLPMQPWDIWPGYKTLGNDDFTPAIMDDLDDLAQHVLDADHNFERYTQYMNNNKKVIVPENLVGVDSLY